MQTLLANPHLPDGELVRLLDGELDVAETQRTNVHLAGCVECRARLERLRGRSRRLGGLLRAADWPLPDAAPAPALDTRDELARRRRASRAAWLRAAALAALLLGGAVLASPARAWITEWIARQWTAATAAPGAESASPPTPASTSGGAAGTRVRFVPAAATFEVDFAARQPGGVLLLEQGNGSDVVVVEVVRGAPGAELLVLPAGVRVRNPANGPAAYRVTVPPGVEQVRVRIAGDAAGDFGGAELARGVRVELGEGTLRE